MQVAGNVNRKSIVKKFFFLWTLEDQLGKHHPKVFTQSPKNLNIYIFPEKKRSKCSSVRIEINFENTSHFFGQSSNYCFFCLSTQCFCSIPLDITKSE